MKTCTHCAQTLPLSDFHRNRTTADGLMAHCKTCRRDIRLRKIALQVPTYYRYSDLRWRPIEHVIETLRCVDIAAALGIDKGVAQVFKREPWTLEDGEICKIRDWLDAA